MDFFYYFYTIYRNYLVHKYTQLKNKYEDYENSSDSSDVEMENITPIREDEELIYLIKYLISGDF